MMQALRSPDWIIMRTSIDKKNRTQTDHVLDTNVSIVFTNIFEDLDKTYSVISLDIN